MFRQTRKMLMVATATAAITLGLPATGALAATTDTSVAPPEVAAATLTLPPICQAVPGSYPGATVIIGNTTAHVPSVGNIHVCLYRYAVTTTGAPVPQFESGCGPVCFKIDTAAVTAGLAPYIQITLTSDGNPVGYTYAPPPVGVGIQEPICVSVGTPAPACTSATLNLAL